VVREGRALLFHRRGDEEILECFDALTGKTRWSTATETRYVDDFGFDEGPRATPAIAGDRVFTFGAEGRASAFDLNTGARLWSVDCKSLVGARKGFFGLAPSPLVEGDVVVVQPGGEGGAGFLALEAATGKVRWKSGDDEASYASPIAVTVAGKRRVLALTREALVSLDPGTGRLLFRHPWRPPMHASVSAATPLFFGDTVFLSASYGTGATLLRYAEAGPSVVWESKDAISCHYSTCVHRDGFLYGYDGRQEQGCQLRCIEAATGKVRWTEPRFGAGTVLLAGGDLLLLGEKGELVRAPASPEGFKPTARAQVLPFLARAHAALSDGRLYARSKDKLFCIELGAAKP
jgi:outer membrane protein assembly factor BamB